MHPPEAGTATGASAAGAATAAGPSMSVVVVTADGCRSIRRTLGCLLCQTVAERLELIVVGPAGERLLPERGELDGLGFARAVELARIDRTAQARAAGARAARAPVIAFVEEHSYPASDWAQWLLEAFDHGWAAVGPRVSNANPGTLTARADFQISYGRWAQASGESDDLPGHNSAYRREVLLGYGDRLSDVLQAETLLHWDLRRHGRRLAVEPQARIEHTSIARLRPWVVKRLLTGRLFAARRSARWSRRRRAGYVLGSALIPLVRWRGLHAQGALCERGSRALALAGLGLEALGEARGYAVGAGDAESRLLSFELRRGEDSAAG